MFYVLTGLLIILAGIYSYINSKFKKFPPGPYGLPFVGYLMFLGTEPHKAYSKIGEKYGKLFSVCLGSLPVVIINDLKLIQKAFKLDVFTGRPKSVLAMKIVSNGLTFNEGPAYIEQRKFLIKTLRELGFGKSSIESTIEDELQNLITYLKTQSGQPINLKPILEISVINTLWTIVAGEKHGFNDPKALYMHKLCYEGFIEPEVAGAVWFMPLLAKIAPVKTGFRNLEKAVGEMRKIFGDFYDKKVESYSENKLNDFVDHYIKQVFQTTDKSSSFFGETGRKNACDLLINIFSAGSDTTSTILYWGILYMLHYPSILQNILHEIKATIGCKRLPRNADRQHMPYTVATLHEILRHASIVPGGLLHSSTEDTYFEKYFLPKGTILMANLYHVHHDKDIWGDDAEEFQPERFLIQDGNVFKNDGALIPFSTGKRICPAEVLAMTNFFVFFVGILQNFEIEPDYYQEFPSLSPKPGLVVGPFPYNIILKLRTTF